MSHFTSLKTKFVDGQSLVTALADLGYKNVEVSETPLNLYGYQGDMRRDTAQIIIRRRHVGAASNDLGFRLSEDGTFNAIISEYDREKHNEQWLKQLTQRYAYHATCKTMTEQGFSLIQEETEQGTIHMVLRRMC